MNYRLAFALKKGLPALIGLCFLLFMAACNSDSNLVNSSSDLKGSVSLVILDANTGLPVDKVTVSIVGGASQKTSGSGQATFADLRAGSYLIRLEKDGYETSQEPVTLGTGGTQQVVAINVSQTFRIHETGVSIKGRVLIRPYNTSDTTATVAGSGVRVELRLVAAGTGSGSTTYLTPVRSVMTTSTGAFSFDSLPEISTYSVAVPEFTLNGKTFSAASVNVASGTLLSGQQYTHPNITLSPVVTGSLQVFAQSLKLVNNQPLVMEFSNPVDTTRFTSTTGIQLRTTVGLTTTNINSTRSWNSSFTVLSITPPSSVWTTGTTYSVVLTGVRDNQNRVLATTTITAVAVP